MAGFKCLGGCFGAISVTLRSIVDARGIGQLEAGCDLMVHSTVRSSISPSCGWSSTPCSGILSQASSIGFPCL